MESYNYICYLDLLGTKNVIKYESGRYWKIVQAFFDALEEACDEAFGREQGLFRESTRIYYFSDCAFISSKNIHGLIHFLKELRLLLISKESDGIYLKAAVIKGRLQGSFYNEKNGLLIGTKFENPSIGSVYEKQDEIKGVSILIDNEIISEKQIDAGLCTSFYIPNVRTNSLVFYVDLKFELNAESQVELCERIIRNYLKTSFKSSRYGRYYIPLLVTLINSLEKDEINQIRILNEQYVNVPFIIHFLINEIPNTYSSILKNLVGLHYVYLSLLNLIYNVKSGSDSLSTVTLRKILANEVIKERISGDFENIPSQVLNDENKRYFMEDFEHIVMRG